MREKVIVHGSVKFKDAGRTMRETMEQILSDFADNHDHSNVIEFDVSRDPVGLKYKYTIEAEI